MAKFASELESIHTTLVSFGFRPEEDRETDCWIRPDGAWVMVVAEDDFYSDIGAPHVCTNVDYEGPFTPELWTEIRARLPEVVLMDDY